MAEHDTLLNAAIGAAVSIVLSFVPLSPVVGGAIAGYLQGGTRSDGLRVGAIAGAMSLVVGAVAFGLFALVFGAIVLGAGTAEAGVIGGLGFLFLFLIAVTTVLYTVALSAVGGWLGNYAKYEMEL